MIFVQVLVDKVKNMNKLVFNRTAWQATKLVKVKVRAYVGPDPLKKGVRPRFLSSSSDWGIGTLLMGR